MDEKFIALGQPRRVWAVGCLYGDTPRLMQLHDFLIDHVEPGDRIVYMGGYASAAHGLSAIDEMLLFRRTLLMRPGMEARDFVYLRGRAEEAWQKLFRIPFAREPEREIERLFDDGADIYLTGYGLTLAEAQSIVRSGVPTMTRWTGRLRQQVRQFAGHEQIASAMRRAAYTTSPGGTPRGLVLVPGGFDPSKSLGDQGEALWSGIHGFGRITGECQGFNRIVRGFDPAGLGLDVRDATLTLDTREGKGPLLTACLDGTGHVLEILSLNPLPPAPPADQENTARAQDKPHLSVVQT
ncbi:MAG: hypothetical protein GC131_09475 [Alphaproteobacteria bacterium]|nr:hypothetical protein [Alphaproteobacteria bacterium]